MVLRDNIKVGTNRQAYIPKNFVNEGFKGDIPVYPTTEFLLLLHPNASSESILSGLESLVRELRVKKLESKKGSK